MRVVAHISCIRCLLHFTAQWPLLQTRVSGEHTPGVFQRLTRDSTMLPPDTHLRAQGWDRRETKTSCAILSGLALASFAWPREKDVCLLEVTSLLDV